MQLRKRTILLLTLTFIVLSCNESTKEESSSDNKEHPHEIVENKNQQLVLDEPVEDKGITITPLVNSPTFEKAALSFANISSGDQLKSGKQTIEMNVKDYQLGVQTSDAKEKGLANSAKGQHMHVILNNEPYMAHYDPKVEVDLKEGHYVALAFFSRSYHESVKNPQAYDLIEFKVGNAEDKRIDLTAPHIFYSRPKGTYSGEDTKEVLFDFYLVNTKLDEEGNKVRLTINEEAEFIIAKWQAYTLKGLPMGENKFKVELLNEKGEVVQTPFNPMERTVTLKKEA
ncbi:MAG: hypothetical protein WDZ35_07545 [Crocinitomicaceae bacterium]